MFLLKLGSKLQNLVKKLQCAMKMLANHRLHFHEVEYFHEVECTGGVQNAPYQFFPCNFYKRGTYPTKLSDF